MTKEEESEYQTFSFTVQMKKTEEKVALQDCTDCENQFEIKENHAVALFGDTLINGVFVPADELKKSYKMWENTLHDINHQGTLDARGMMVASNILYFVGYNDNVTYNEETKAMSMDIHICDNTHYASAWRGYMELCEKSGQTPNVSVSFRAKTKAIRVSDLPEGVNYQAYGLSKDDYVKAVYDFQPDALSTVFRGACSDKNGCGIGMESQKEDKEEQTSEADEVSEEEQKEIAEKRKEIITWLKQHENK